MTALNPARTALLKMFALDAKIVRGSGFHLVDEDGRAYLDFLAQYGALPFGHNPPELWAALQSARDSQMPSMVQPMRPVEAERLAERLAEITPGDLSITTLTNSGAETVEAAIKLARLRTGRHGILSTRNGFHGKTLGALSATGKPMYQKGFSAPAPGFDYIPFGDLEALRERLMMGGESIAAFIVEPIQGEGGVVCPSEGYIDAAIAICREHGVLFILDEIQTGLGRTGELFACSSMQEVPDMLLLSKALGGGMMPIGACIVRPDAWHHGFGQRHSSTFANNNLACCVANATLDLLLRDDQALVRQVASNGIYLMDKLETLKSRYPEVIRDVRGRGYMIGLEFNRFDDRMDSATMAFSSINGGVLPLISSYLFNVQGILTAPLFNETHVMRLQPTLIAGKEEIDRALEALDAVCAIIQARDYYSLVRHLVSKPIDADMSSEDGVQVISAVDSPTASEAGRFAFLIHYTEKEDIFRSDPSFRQFSDDELENWCAWVKQFGPGFARKIPKLTSKSGAEAEGWIMSVPMLPSDMIGKRRKLAVNMIKSAVDLAAEDGASRVGLGAFTSISTRGGNEVTGRGASITSGNTLSTISAVKGIERVAKRTRLPMQSAKVVVVGASGAIGRLGALMLARQAGQITLVGNAANPFSPKLLEKVADEVYETLLDETQFQGIRAGGATTEVRRLAQKIDIGDDRHELARKFNQACQALGRCAPIEYTTPLEAALADADIVLVATSAEMALLDPSMLQPGTLVCDVARPPNVENAEIHDNAVFVFDGGLIQPPFEIDLGPFQTLPKNLCWGCLGETMLLALAGETKDYSIGPRLSLKDADELAKLAKIHGFEPAPTQWYGRHARSEDFDGFAANVARRHQKTRSSAHLSAQVG